MFDKLELLKKLGYFPDAVLDIGAYHGKWTQSMKQIYDTSEYFLFEAINYKELASFNNVFNVVLNDKIEERDWYEMRNTGDSLFREKTKWFSNCEVKKRKTTTLDTVIQKNKALFDKYKNLFIKIDCQGAEIPILKGASTILQKTDFVLLEIPLFGNYNQDVPSFKDHVVFMETIGFIPYDILESHYIGGFNMQVDMLFINKSHSFNRLVNDQLL